MNTAAPRPDSGHFPRLDVLRGVAIIGVFLVHYLHPVFGRDQLAWNGLWRDPASAPGPAFWWCYPLTFGWIGVSLFFVLSGFCIHLSFLRRGSLSIRRFYLHRFWRIYPPYLIALVLFALLGKLNIASAEGLTQLLSHVFLVHNLHDQTLLGINPAFWSLATEAQFYLAYPLLLVLRSKLGMGGALVGTLALSVLCRGILAAASDWSTGLSPAAMTLPMILWFDWTLGAWLAERVHADKTALPPQFSGAAPAFAALFLLSTVWKPLSLFTFSLASCLCAIVVARYLASRQPIRRWERWLIPVGLISYSVYLLHQPLIGRCLGVLHRLGLPDTALANLTVGLAVTGILIGAVSYLFHCVIERPCMRWKQRSRIAAPDSYLPASATNATQS